jgi:hypothetical protein
MRFRVGVVLCLLAVYVGVGCRDPLTPNIDRNEAPETWITAAPFDTITTKDANLNPTQFPFPGTIPIRFHVYWAGADKDGAVTGFYYAVVETLPRPLPGQFFFPNLPGPKPSDYRYTTKTDSFFIFTVAENVPDRQHAFFIYAVDNLGKADPTPARFVFNALDRFPPIPIIEECRCIGKVYKLNASGGVDPQLDTTYVTDVDDRSNPTLRDTCAAGSRIDIKWHGEVQVPQVVVTGYRYKLDEPRLVEVGAEVTGTTYNSGIPPDTIAPAPGRKIFLLRVVDQAFGSRDSTRRFQLNYAPDTWWAGPDPNSGSLQTDPVTGEKLVVDPPGPTKPTVVGSLMSDDSVRVMPALRTPRNTFFELWKDTLWLRSDGDTVHMNSWVILHAGGFDKDSRYLARVTDLARGLPDFPAAPHPVLDPEPVPNGSPVGFRSVITMALTPSGLESRSAFIGPYPVFDPNSVFNLWAIAGYHPVFQAGRAFAVVQAEDADGDPDRRVVNGRDLVQRIEAGAASPEEAVLRDKVLAFEVDKPPFFKTDLPNFRPRVAVVDTFPSPLWDLRLPAADPDPFRLGTNTNPGGPSAVVTLRRRITIRGTGSFGQSIIYQHPTDFINQENINILLPDALAGGPCTLEVQLCDCDQCEELEGTGRCVKIEIPVYYQPAAPSAPASTGPTGFGLSNP